MTKCAAVARPARKPLNERPLMPNIPTHIAKLFEDSGAGARHVNRGNRTTRSRFDMQPRRRSPRARNERH